MSMSSSRSPVTTTQSRRPRSIFASTGSSVRLRHAIRTESSREKSRSNTGCVADSSARESSSTTAAEEFTAGRMPASPPRGRRCAAGRYLTRDTLRFGALTGVRSMSEVFPLEHAVEAYERMIGGKARFRVVLTTGLNRRRLHRYLKPLRLDGTSAFPRPGPT